MHAVRLLHPALIAALLVGVCATGASAASNKVYRCTGANGKVTLSDRRCPEDDGPAKADAVKAAASQASAAADNNKACVDARDRLAERRKQKSLGEAERKALKQLEDEHRRTCGA